MPVTHAQNATGPCLGSSRAPSTEPAAHGKSVVDRPSHVEHAAALAGRLQAEVALVHQRAHECSAESCRAEQRRAARNPRRKRRAVCKARRTCDAEHQPHVRCQRGGRVQAAHDTQVQWPCHWLCRVDFCTPQARLRHAAASSSALLLNRREAQGRRLRLRSAARRWRMHEHALAAGPVGADAGGVSPVLVQIWQGCAGVGACTSTHPVRKPVRRCGGDRLSALSCCRSTCACARACGCAVASAGARRATALARACHGPHSKMPLRDSPLTSARTRARAHSCYRKRRSVA